MDKPVFINTSTKYNEFYIIIDITVEVKLKAGSYAEPVSWSLGDCDSNQWNGPGNEYENYRTYTANCSFFTSPTLWIYPLACKHSRGGGWSDGYIEINGVKYCEDFQTGHQLDVFVEANPS